MATVRWCYLLYYSRAERVMRLARKQRGEEHLACICSRTLRLDAQQEASGGTNPPRASLPARIQDGRSAPLGSYELVEPNVKMNSG
ncbi:hypothetical protein KOW79_013101 [Hemibagrus wyckioides]|uniref:Uncharacterized protein n=1 Tax=Hemibagrus wyckioides TaxID=337641 RepID=A0A9D3NKB5_9TELE|nr:hypothetical protein KOW79_013101 [Hemibagrus wyckioides]